MEHIRNLSSFFFFSYTVFAFSPANENPLSSGICAVFKALTSLNILDEEKEEKNDDVVSVLPYACI